MKYVRVRARIPIPMGCGYPGCICKLVQYALSNILAHLELLGAAGGSEHILLRKCIPCGALLLVFFEYGWNYNLSDQDFCLPPHFFDRKVMCEDRA